MFQTYFNPNNSLLIILQISLLFGFTPALMTDYYGAFSTSTSNFLGQIQSASIDTSYTSILTCLYNNKKISKIIWLKCSPVSAPPPTPLMGLSYGEQSLCRVPPSPVHPHEGAPMLFYYNFFIFEAKSLICSLVGAFLWLSRGVASLRCQVCFRSSVVVNLHFSCPNSASVLSSCYSWYQFTWNCLQLEFSENH